MKITREIVQALADGAPPDPQDGDYAEQMQAIAAALLARMPTLAGPGVHVRLNVIVDPCGRVLVSCQHRISRPCASRSIGGCVRHTVDLVVPCPRAVAGGD